MKKTLILIFALYSLTALSQTDIAPVRKLNFGLSVIPELNQLIVGNPVGQESVKAKMGLSAGFTLEFRLSEKSFIRSGIGCGKKNYDHTHSGLIFGNDIDPQTGLISTSRVESNVSFFELQIPLIFHYYVKENTFFIGGGIEAIYPIVNNSVRTIYYGNGDVEILSNTTENGINVAPVISFGYKQPLSDRLSLSIEPMFKYYLLEYIIGESNLYNLGLKTTLNF